MEHIEHLRKAWRTGKENFAAMNDSVIREMTRYYADVFTGDSTTYDGLPLNQAIATIDSILFRTEFDDM